MMQHSSAPLEPCVPLSQAELGKLVQNIRLALSYTPRVRVRYMYRCDSAAGESSRCWALFSGAAERRDQNEDVAETNCVNLCLELGRGESLVFPFPQDAFSYSDFVLTPGLLSRRQHPPECLTLSSRCCVSACLFLREDSTPLERRQYCFGTILLIFSVAENLPGWTLILYLHEPSIRSYAEGQDLLKWLLLPSDVDDSKEHLWREAEAFEDEEKQEADSAKARCRQFSSTLFSHVVVVRSGFPRYANASATLSRFAPIFDSQLSTRFDVVVVRDVDRELTGEDSWQIYEWLCAVQRHSAQPKGRTSSSPKRGRGADSLDVPKLHRYYDPAYIVDSRRKLGGPFQPPQKVRARAASDGGAMEPQHQHFAWRTSRETYDLPVEVPIVAGSFAVFAPRGISSQLGETYFDYLALIGPGAYCCDQYFLARCLWDGFFAARPSDVETIVMSFSGQEELQIHKRNAGPLRRIPVYKAGKRCFPSASKNEVVNVAAVDGAEGARLEARGEGGTRPEEEDDSDEQQRHTFGSLSTNGGRSDTLEVVQAPAPAESRDPANHASDVQKMEERTNETGWDAEDSSRLSPKRAPLIEALFHDPPLQASSAKLTVTEFHTHVTLQRPVVVPKSCSSTAKPSKNPLTQSLKVFAQRTATILSNDYGDAAERPTVSPEALLSEPQNWWGEVLDMKLRADTMICSECLACRAKAPVVAIRPLGAFGIPLPIWSLRFPDHCERCDGGTPRKARLLFGAGMVHRSTCEYLQDRQQDKQSCPEFIQY